VVEHAPLEQSNPPVQTVPHAPQLFGSDAMFAQPDGHAVRPTVQVHCPLVQLCVPVHALLHMPQWRGSLATVVHPLLQTSCPTAHCAPPAVPPVPVPATPPVPSSSSSAVLPSPPVPWAEQLAPITKSNPKSVSPTVVRMAQFLAYPAIPCNRKSSGFEHRALGVSRSGTDSSWLRISTRRRKAQFAAFPREKARREITMRDG
jgi:hypothetical protein